MKRLAIALALSGSLGLGACGSDPATSTITGGALGAGGGAAIGALAGNAGMGAAIGAGVGVLGGYLSSKYKVEKRK